MEMPINLFKQRLMAGDGPLLGLWVTLADPVAAEISAGAGADWVMIDGEHSPNDVRTLLNQFQATAAYDVATLARPPSGGPKVIKQYLDLGVQTLLIPMVDSAEQAANAVEFSRYPPAGIRGVASARAARWGRVENYHQQANDQTCVICQIETKAGLDNLEAIAAVDGVDALFVGPSDLSASLGRIGEAGSAEMRKTVIDTIDRIRDAGKAAGTLSLNAEIASEYIDAGASFIAVANDATLLAKGTTEVIASFRD